MHKKMLMLMIDVNRKIASVTYNNLKSYNLNDI